MPQSALYSNETARVIDEEVARLIREAHDRVAKTLGEQRQTLETLARLLLEREVVDRAALDVVLGTKGAPPPAAATATPVRDSVTVD